jgi:hypothetical protein
LGFLSIISSTDDENYGLVSIDKHFMLHENYIINPLIRL